MSIKLRSFYRPYKGLKPIYSLPPQMLCLGFYRPYKGLKHKKIYMIYTIFICVFIVPIRD